MIGSTAVNVTARSHCPSPKANLSQHPTQAAQSLPALRNCCSLPNVSLRPRPAVLPLKCLMGKYLERNDLRGEMLCIFVKKLSKRKNPNAREERKWLCCFGLGYLCCWRHLELAWPGNPALHAVWLCAADTVSLLRLESSANAMADFRNFTFRVQN